MERQLNGNVLILKSLASAGIQVGSAGAPQVARPSLSHCEGIWPLLAKSCFPCHVAVRRPSSLCGRWSVCLRRFPGEPSMPVTIISSSSLKS